MEEREVGWVTRVVILLFRSHAHTLARARQPNQSYEPLFFMINHSKKKTKTTNAISAHICSLPPVCIKLLS